MTAEQYSNEVLELLNENKELYKKMADLNKGNVLEERYNLQHITLTKIHEKLKIKHRQTFKIHLSYSFIIVTIKRPLCSI